MGGGGHGDSGDDEVPPAHALDMGFPAREHHSSRLASRGRALPLQVTRQRLRCRQGKTLLIPSFVGMFEYSPIGGSLRKNGS